MSTDAALQAGHFGRWEQIQFGREVMRTEGHALLALADRLHDEFCRALDILSACSGSVIVTGMGKAGLVGQKVAATLASTGTRSHFLHAGEAVHGDLGRIHRDDVVLVLSYSGETEEVTRLLPSLREFGTPIIAITGQPGSRLGRAAHVTLDLGPIREACSLGLAPSTSTTAMLALGDALALVLSRMRRFSSTDFARFHPAGSLGRKLARVDDVMRPLSECRVAHESSSVRDVFVRSSRPGRRTGAVMLVDDAGTLAGIFTDSDLARLLERRLDSTIDGPISAVMTRRPTTVLSGSALNDSLALLTRRKLSELPVVDAAGRPHGLIDITDIVGLLPRPQTCDDNNACDENNRDDGKDADEGQNANDGGASTAMNNNTDLAERTDCADQIKSDDRNGCSADSPHILRFPGRVELGRHETNSNRDCQPDVEGEA